MEKVASTIFVHVETYLQNHSATSLKSIGDKPNKQQPKSLAKN